jgi:predicted PurR-regulated permease PerM
MANFFIRYRRIIIFFVVIIAFFWLLWILRNVLLPFILGLILAYLLYPPIIWLENRLPRKDRWKGAKRVFLIILVYLIFIAVIGVVGYFTIPALIRSVSDFFSNLPEIIPNITDTFQRWTDSLRQQVPPQIRDQIDAYLANLMGTVGSALQTGLLRGLSIISAGFGFFVGFVSLPVFVFYLLKDAEKLNAGFYSGLSSWNAEQARNIIGIIQDVLGRYIRVQLLLGLAVGILAFIGLMALRIPFAPALALWAGLSEMVPVLGPWIGGVPGVIVTLATEPGKTIWVLVLYFAVQLTENVFLVPRIAGQSYNIHPALILILIVVGGHFAGIWGIILIVPLVATLAKLFSYISHVTRKEQLQGPGP